MRLTDGFGRVMGALRVSVTDRCDLVCSYCRPHGAPALDARGLVPSFEEITRLVRVFLRLGVTRVRLTGGEPLRRRGLAILVRALKTAGVPDLALTTNGTALAGQAAALARAGLDRLNVSLDSLDPARFAAITGVDALPRVLAGIEAARAAGLFPLRFNAVAMRGVNDDELCALARYAVSRGGAMRFIEFMPVGVAPAAWEHRYLPAAAILESLRPVLAPGVTGLPDGPGPARYLPLAGGGEVGIIAGVSRPFCGTCDRLRLSARGALRLCLASPLEVDLLAPLRAGAADDELGRIIRAAVRRKPTGASYTEARAGMSVIGG